MTKYTPIILGIALIALGTTGCSTSRDARTSSAEQISAAHSTTINKTLEQGLIPNVVVSGSSNTISIAPPMLKSETEVNDHVNTEGAATNMSRTIFHASLSTWVFGCLSLALLLIAFILFSKLTASGAAMDKIGGDAAMAFGSILDQITTLAAHVTTDEAATALATIKASVEKGRGKVGR